MYGNRFIATAKDGYLEVKNLSSSKITDVRVVANDYYWTSIIDSFIDLQPFEVVNLPFFLNNFRVYLDNEKFQVNIYVNDVLEYTNTFNDKSRCWVLYSNKAFEPLVEQLIIGLTRWSKIDIVHYSIGYKSELDYPKLINIEYPVSGDLTDGQFMQMVKPIVFVDVLERGYKNVIFIDADIQVRKHIDTLFEMTSQIIDAPIFQRCIWDYTLVNGQYIPGPKLTEAMNLPLRGDGSNLAEQIAPQGITNLVIFNSSHMGLFLEWKEICHSEIIQKIRHEEFMHDELILNCLMWKRGIKPHLRWMGLNVVDYKDVDLFYNYQFGEKETTMNLNDHGQGHWHQSILPRDKSLVRFFHCVKAPSVAAMINQMILERD